VYVCEYEEDVAKQRYDKSIKNLTDTERRETKGSNLSWLCFSLSRFFIAPAILMAEGWICSNALVGFEWRMPTVSTRKYIHVRHQFIEAPLRCALSSFLALSPRQMLSCIALKPRMYLARFLFHNYYCETRERSGATKMWRGKLWHFEQIFRVFSLDILDKKNVGSKSLTRSNLIHLFTDKLRVAQCETKVSCDCKKSRFMIKNSFLPCNKCVTTPENRGKIRNCCRWRDSSKDRL